MLTGFGSFGTEPGEPPPVPAPLRLESGPVAVLGASMLTEESPQVCERSFPEPRGVSSMYCLSRRSHLDNQKYMHLGIGAAAGAVIAGVAVYALTR